MSEWKRFGYSQVVQDLHVGSKTTETFETILHKDVRVKAFHGIQCCNAEITIMWGKIVDNLGEVRGWYVPVIVKFKGVEPSELFLLTRHHTSMHPTLPQSEVHPVVVSHYEPFLCSP